MGQRCLLRHIIFVLDTCFQFHSALCRSLSSESDSSDQYTTTVLDVAASIQRTRDVLSFHPQTTLKQIEKLPNITKPYSSSSSWFFLPLHPRSSLHEHHHKDYKDLVHARLDRDYARVKFLSTKHELALNGSELESVEQDVGPIPVETNGQTGEYFAHVGVGQPVRKYLMVVDTGSDVTWLQCKPCFTYDNQSVRIFDPSASSTYRPLSCDSPQCKALPSPSCEVKSKSSCPYVVPYTDGSTSTGDLAIETLSFGNSGSVINDFPIGCGHANKNFNDTEGLLGLGRGPLSLTSQLKASSFSYCLVDRDSSKSSTLEFNSARPGNSVTAKLLRNPQSRNTHFYVGLTGISVGGQPLNISRSLFQIENGNGGIIVDSGTTVTWLKPEAYQALRGTFVRMMSTQGMLLTRPDKYFDTCYDMSSFKIADVPTISFEFSDGQSLMLPADNYIIPIESGKGKFCLAFISKDISFSILGNVQQQGMRVSFDLVNSIIGFSPNKC